MRRILRRIVHNWPLKLAAVGLATLMYGGLALSQNTQVFQGDIPVRVANLPPKTFNLSKPEPVTQIRYFAPSGVPVATSTFSATVDLSGIKPTGGVVSVRIQVESVDGRVRVLGYEPMFASIHLDPLVSEVVPVKVEHGTVPDGLTLGDTKVDPPSVVITGPKSVVDQVVAARADVQIQPSGIDVDQDVKLVPVDSLGNAVSPVDVTPATARVTIPVFSDRQTRTLTVNVIFTGTPAAGFEIASITVQPLAVAVAGDADQLAELVRVDTEPVPLTGVSSDLTTSVRLALPTGIVPVGNDVVVVTIKLRPVTATRTFNAGIRLVGARSDLTYDVAVDQVLLTIGGSVAELDRLSGSSLVVDLDVTVLTAGSADVPVTADLPAGTILVAASPSKVRVTVTGTALSGSPGPTNAPGASISPGSSPSGG